ncbi:hypothetical protein LVB77_03260 [Lysobacter sp. 5GHs7-4]|uniref:hypothetical protein n=1 Tax=Lysobacter sp. 5GHs7-4 TaxID=2904253 RepID=UPI001E52C7C8|nr:hypothetical protein [Lysobacter sp. 5GHs7-4]UHQ23747.1 hypothetical protein LVB77_03260 [Lysobacter sp. 5GHs7-4]
MNRRNFVQGLALIAASMAAPLAIADTSSKTPEQVATPQAAQSFRKVAVVECTIVDMVNGKQRVVSIENSEPVVIKESSEPFAISINEHSDDLLSMTIYTLRNGRMTKEQRTYIGQNSTQILKKKGVVLQFVTHGT